MNARFVAVLQADQGVLERTRACRGIPDVDDFHFRIFQQSIEELTVLIRTDRACFRDLPCGFVKVVNFLNWKFAVKDCPVREVDAERHHGNI